MPIHQVREPKSHATQPRDTFKQISGKTNLNTEHYPHESQVSQQHDPQLEIRFSNISSSESFEMNEMLEPSNDSSYPQDFEVEESEQGSDGESPISIEHGQIHSKSLKKNFELYTPDEERTVIRIFDRRLVLFIAFLYMLSFLDRSNIGNAKIAGLSHDLKLTSPQYEWLLRAFYITYILFEWMTLLYRVFPPHIYIAICVASWGFVASLQSITPSFSFLLVLRALLGVCEAAFGPGVPFYLSFFYKRDELALRTGLFISAAPLATSFASSLAWAITKAGRSIPIAPWRMLFLVEGFPSIVVAAFAWYHIPDSPGTASYLTKRLKKVALLRLRKEKNIAEIQGGKTGLKWREIWDTMTDPKCYLTAAMFFCCNVAFSSLPVFLPTIIEQMGHSALVSQALCAPPYLLAFLIVLLTAYLSDLQKNRSYFITIHSLLAACGYAIIAIAGFFEAHPAYRYAGVFPATTGFFSSITIIITWTINNQDSDSKRGTGVAILNIFGQFGPLIGVHLYPANEGPYYVHGMAICAGFMAAVAVLALVLRAILAAKNRCLAAPYEPVGTDYEDNARGGRLPARFKFLL